MDTVNTYNEIVEKYKKHKSVSVLPLVPPTKNPTVIPVKIKTDTVSATSTKSSLLSNIFKLTTLLSFLLLCFMTFKVLSNLSEKQNVVPPTPLPPATPTLKPQDQACILNDTPYQVGQSMMAADGCNTCTCTESGKMECTELSCQATLESKPQTPTIAPTTCTFKNKKYKPGQSYKDGTKTCLCTEEGTAVCAGS